MRKLKRALVKRLWAIRRAIEMRRGVESYVKFRYKRLMGRDIDLDHPTTFSEKIQWLKLYAPKPETVLYADKYLVREHVKNTVGEKYLIPLIAAWDKASEIDFDALPDSFVIKPNNSSGRVLICKDKSMLDRKRAYKTVDKWSRENLTKLTGEWFYEKIPYKIVCEEYLEDDISDYKLFFADGEFICTQIIAGRHSGQKTFTYYDEKWSKLPIVRYGTPVSDEAQEMPEKYAEMIEIGEKLAEGFKFIRVDLYYVKGNVYFGELSFYPNNGFVRFQTEEMDKFFASRIKLPTDGEYNE